MWARHIESVVGVWLAFSWLIFRYPPELHLLKYNDWICGAFIIVFALIPYWERFRYCHLLNFLVGSWLIGWVFYNGTGIDFGPHQNYMVIGLLLLMLSVIPARTKEPPRDWVEFLAKKKHD